ncbi:MAG: transcriptional repressor [Roseburia sp.]|nr:transcriptional repressor [Roseburia sp.]
MEKEAVITSDKQEQKTVQTEYPQGLKWTRQRKQVYEILQEAKEPLSAVQIFGRLEKEAAEQYALSTVYRILAAFEERKLVNRITWMGDTVVYERNRGEHTHYAVCLDCRRRIPLEHCPFADIPLEKETGDFTITAHKLELYGYCRDCVARHKTR